MVSSAVAYTVLIALVGVERLVELRLSARNAAIAKAKGGVEVGQRHYGVMAVMHTLFLLSCVGEVWLLARGFPGVVGWAALGVALTAQGLRYWAISTLGARWNTRVIVLPEDEPVTSGPYRLVRHPNYVAVIAEIAALPLVHGAWITALVFSAANAVVLMVRIRVEEAALGESWARAFRGKARFVPGGSRG